jgi:phage terminase large subunit
VNAEFPEKLRPLFKPARYKVAHGGRGSAKSWGFARALLIQAAQRPLRVLCTREIQKSIKDSVHRLLSDQIQALGLGQFFEVLETEIRGRNGSIFLFAGLAQHTVESIKSFEGVDRVWIEEAQVVTKRSWDVLTPTIRAVGSEIWLSLNPDMETGETYQRFVAHPPADAIVIQMNWRDNPWFPEVLENERLETLRRDPDNYDNIWEGVPKRVSEGAIYRIEVERLYADRRARRVPYDPLLPVDTVWDLGWNDAMTIGMFQRSSAEVRCIDYIEDSHHTLDWYVGQIEKRDYRWGKDFIPHDGRARDFKTGKSTEELLTTLRGKKPHVLPAESIEEGIKAARMMFPRAYVDEDKCARLLECLKRYRRAISQSTGEPGAPLHDEFSHGADMWRYAAQAVELMGQPEKKRVRGVAYGALDSVTGY